MADSPLRARVQPLVQAGSFLALRLAFRVGERIAPAVAARHAEALWMKVPAPKPPGERDRGLPPGEPVAVDVAGSRLEVYAWGQGPVVLVAHGWSGWWQQMSVHIEALVAQGFRVVAWDAPSHGSSGPGRFGEGNSGMPDLQDAVRAVADAVAPHGARGIVAHSGGSMAAALAVADGLRVDRVALIAPSIGISDVLDMLSRRLGWGPRTTAALLERLSVRYRLTLADFDVPARIAAAEALPALLVVADADDEETPLAGARELARAWPGAELMETTGLGHYRVLWSPLVVARVAGFLRD